MSLGKPLPKYIRLDTGTVYSLRRVPKVLRIHASSKKAGDEEYFAELQLFSSWRSSDLKDWRKTIPNLINAFQKNHKDILKVRSKVFPFSMKELIEEVKATEVLNQLPDEIKNKLFAAGAQLDSIELLEECDEIDQLLTEFDS